MKETAKRQNDVEWEVCQAHQIGMIMDYGGFDVECVAKRELREIRKTIVLERIDGEGRTTFRLAEERWVPKDKDVPASAWENGSRQARGDLLYFELDAESREIKWIGKWQGGGLYTEEELKGMFGYWMHKSLKNRLAGVRADAGAKTKI